MTIDELRKTEADFKQQGADMEQVMSNLRGALGRETLTICDSVQGVQLW